MSRSGAWPSRYYSMSGSTCRASSARLDARSKPNAAPTASLSRAGFMPRAGARGLAGDRPASACGDVPDDGGGADRQAGQDAVL